MEHKEIDLEDGERVAIYWDGKVWVCDTGPGEPIRDVTEKGLIGKLNGRRRGKSVRPVDVPEDTPHPAPRAETDSTQEP